MLPSFQVLKVCAGLNPRIAACSYIVKWTSFRVLDCWTFKDVTLDSAHLRNVFFTIFGHSHSVFN